MSKRKPLNDGQRYTLAGLLLLLVASSQYRVITGQLGLVINLPGGKSTVNVPLPAGPSGKTFLPLKNMQKPNATAFLDTGYHAGYPNSAGRATVPALVGYWHTGIDANGPAGGALGCNNDQGNPVYACRDGVIEYAGPGGGSWGPIIVQKVMVDGVPYWLRYAHVQASVKGFTGSKMVKTGQTVKAGDVLAGIGRGDPAHPWPCAHLHFDVFFKKPPTWGWWPTRNGPTSQVTALLTDPAAWLARLNAAEVTA